MTKRRKQYLKYLCLQYKDKCRRLNEATFYSSPNLENHKTCASRHDVQENQIINKIVAEAEINAIDDCLNWVDVGLRDKLKINITTGASYESLNVPCSRMTFYRIKKNFFKELDKKIL